MIIQNNIKLINVGISETQENFMDYDFDFSEITNPNFERKSFFKWQWDSLKSSEFLIAEILNNMKNFKIIIIFILIFIVNSSYGQNKNPILTNNYYKINKKQKSIVEFYLLARYYYPFGNIRSYNKMYSTSPDLIAIDKDGKILDFDSYKSEYKNSNESKKEFSINLFYLGYNNSKNNNELIMSYTVLEPNWANVLEVKEYEYRKECPIGCEKLYERPVRKVHKPIIIYKFNQKFRIYYMNDYE